jgi:hypothetical protein
MSMSPLLFRRSPHGRAGLFDRGRPERMARLSAFGVSRRTRRNSRALESFDFEHSAADCIQSYVPAASLWIGGRGHRSGTPDSLPGGPSARSALIFSASGLSMAVQFPKGTFKVDPDPGEHGVSVLFKPTQSTVVFSITSPGALATEYQVYHVNAGGFRRFSETEVVEAARELALHFVERAGPR